MNRFRLELVLAVTLTWCGCTRGMADDQAQREKRIVYGKPKQLATLANRSVRESSGLCWDASNRVFWTHNDSGGAAAIYAFDTDGRNHGRFIVRGAKNNDWEDMAAAKIGEHHRLIVADVGNNNNAKKTTVTLYIIAPPKLDSDKPLRGGNAGLVMKIPFRFDTGPVDCEAIAYDPIDHAVVLISKELGFWCKAYVLKLPEKEPDKPLAAKKIVDLELMMVTAADISPDGRRLVAATYRHAYEFVRGPKQTWAEALDALPRRIVMPKREMGESVCYGEDGRSIYLTSEGTPCPVWKVPAEEESQ